MSFDCIDGKPCAECVDFTPMLSEFVNRARCQIGNERDTIDRIFAFAIRQHLRDRGHVVNA